MDALFLTVICITWSSPRSFLYSISSANTGTFLLLHCINWVGILPPKIGQVLTVSGVSLTSICLHSDINLCSQWERVSNIICLPDISIILLHGQIYLYYLSVRLSLKDYNKLPFLCHVLNHSLTVQLTI